MFFVNSGKVDNSVGMRDSDGFVWLVEEIEVATTILVVPGSRVAL